MNTNPINLAVRFLLEIAMLLILACWGWHMCSEWPRYLYALLLPAMAAFLWGTFRIPNDPKPAPVAIPGIMRLLLEWLLFGFAVWILVYAQHKRLAEIMLAVLVIHYLVSYDRTWAMLRNKPYYGFVKTDHDK